MTQKIELQVVVPVLQNQQTHRLTDTQTHKHYLDFLCNNSHTEYNTDDYRLFTTPLHHSSHTTLVQDSQNCHSSLFSLPRTARLPDHTLTVLLLLSARTGPIV